MKFLFAVGLLAAGSAYSLNIQVAYMTGKLVQDVVVPVATTDTVKIGNYFSLRLYQQSSGILVCGAQSSRLMQVITPGDARRWIQSDTNWMAASGYPADNLTRPLDSMSTNILVPPAGPASAPGAPVHLYAYSGQFNDCTGATWSFDSGYQRVIFVQSGNVRAKFKITGYVARDESISPLNQYYYLTSVTIRIVANTNANDLADPHPPVAIRGNAGGRSRSLAHRGWREQVSYDFYNPLGTRVKSVNLHEAALPRVVRRNEASGGIK